jgi:flavoprotein
MKNENLKSVNIDNSEICQHEDICVIEEIPTDGINRQQGKVYVKCKLCSQILPIRSIEQKTIEVPLYPNI